MSSCTWNRTWDPPVLDLCAAAACQQIPFPGKEKGLVHLEDPANPITIASGATIYDPQLPLDMTFPGPDFCEENDQQMLLVGRIPSTSKAPLEIIFSVNNTEEAFHVLVEPAQEYVQLWSVQGGLKTNVVGQQGDGTTIDLDEPFILR